MHYSNELTIPFKDSSSYYKWMDYYNTDDRLQWSSQILQLLENIFLIFRLGVLKMVGVILLILAKTCSSNRCMERDG